MFFAKSVFGECFAAETLRELHDDMSMVGALADGMVEYTYYEGAKVDVEHVSEFRIATKKQSVPKNKTTTTKKGVK